jgi:hypothetical protein
VVGWSVSILLTTIWMGIIVPLEYVASLIYSKFVSSDIPKKFVVTVPTNPFSVSMLIIGITSPAAAVYPFHSVVMNLLKYWS